MTPRHQKACHRQHSDVESFRECQTALHRASANGFSEVVQLLLQHDGVDVNSRDNVCVYLVSFQYICVCDSAIFVVEDARRCTFHH